MILLVVSLVGIGWLLGDATATSRRLQFECEPGFVMSRREQNGDLTCWHERTDFRERLEKRKGRKK